MRSRLRRNGDLERRRAERSAASDGTPHDEARLLVARMRAGELDPERVRIAAALGDEVARLADPQWRAWISYLGYDLDGLPRVGEEHADRVILTPWFTQNVADELRLRRPWGPEVAYEVWRLSQARVEPALRYAGTNLDNRYALASDRSLTALANDRYGSALGHAAAAVAWALDEGEEGFGRAQNEEEDRQRADMIAVLLGRQPAPAGVWPGDEGMSATNPDERIRGLERRAAQGDHQAQQILISMQLRAGVVTPPSRQLAMDDPLRHVLAARANREVDWPPTSRRSGRVWPPHLTASSPREAVLAWLQWEDPNGAYVDEWAVGDGLEPLTESEAWDALRRVVDVDPDETMNPPRGDEHARDLERRAAQGDLQAAAQLATARARAGHGVDAWYQEHLAPLGVPEEDFRVLLRVLVRGWHQSDGRSWGPRYWAWLSMPMPLQGERRREAAVYGRPLFHDLYVLGVRGSSRLPSNIEVLDDVITVGFTVVPRKSNLALRGDFHPREAWDELATHGYSPPWPDPPFPTFYYTSFERRFRGPMLQADWERMLEALPSGTTIGGHGCEIHGPDPCHADEPRGKMVQWSRRQAPDRIQFGVADVRLYVGVDPITGVPPDSAPSARPLLTNPQVRRSSDERERRGVERRPNPFRWRLEGISPSWISGKKYVAIFHDEVNDRPKTVHFGATGYEDYTTHRDPERKRRYLERHGRGREDWGDPATPGALSRWILWNKPTLEASVRDFKRRFKL